MRGEIEVLMEKNLNDVVQVLLLSEKFPKNGIVYLFVAEDDAPKDTFMSLQNPTMFQVERTEKIRLCYYNTLDEVLDFLTEIFVEIESSSTITMAFYDAFLLNYLTQTHSLLLYLVYRLTRLRKVGSYVNLRVDSLGSASPSLKVLSKWLRLPLIDRPCIA